MKLRSGWAAGLLLLLALAMGTAVACNAITARSQSATPTPVPLSAEVPQELRIIWETYRLLQQDYVERGKVDPKVLSEAAVRGMVEALNDPYTSYIGPGLFRLEQENLRGSFEGIGAVVGLRDGKLTVVSPIAGGPAERAGIRGGDILLEVNDEPTASMSLNEAVLKIRGPKGTKVKLLIERQGRPVPEVVGIVRDEIKMTSVHTQLLPEGFLRLQVTHFGEATAQDVVAALRQARSERARGVILDLRNNPGGFLSTSVEVASQFLDGGIVVAEIDAQGNRGEWKVREGGVAKDIPLVVLVNQASASGSEVVAGALQDRGRAKLVGTRTFGKGSVNLVRSLSNGGGLYITSARWATPNGRLIEGKGLEPDIVVELPANGEPSGEDIQLQRAVQVLQEEIAVQARPR